MAIDRSPGATRDAAYVMEQIIAGGNFGHHFDDRHDPRRHYKAGALRRKLVSVQIILGDRKKYALINPVIFRKVLGEAISSALLGRDPNKRKRIVL